MPTDSPLILGRAIPAQDNRNPDLAARAEALLAQARKRHDDEMTTGNLSHHRNKAKSQIRAALQKCDALAAELRGKP